MSAQYHHHQQQRMQEIMEMLAAIGRGDYTYRIKPSPYFDELESVCEGLNMMAEELQASSHGLERRSRMSFSLDEDFIIRGFNQGVPQLLHYHSKELPGIPFSNLVAQQSKDHLEEIQRLIRSKKAKYCTRTLHFHTKASYALATFCSIFYLVDPNTKKTKIWVIATPDKEGQKVPVDTPHNNTAYMPGAILNTPRYTTFDEDDVRKVFHARDYMLQHLAEPVKLSDLVFASGMNKVKLQQGFKEIFGTTAFGFLTVQRMEKAKTYLSNTDLPLRKVARRVGYSEWRFVKVFKNVTGYTPGTYRGRGA